jgi:DNA modification methylase/ParB-like chromosome segregation protein Spo0J
MRAEIISLQQVKLPEERQRTDKVDDHVAKLAKSIAENGLIHAITLDGDDNLVAGWCRYHAILSLREKYYYGGTELEAGNIPVVYTHKTSPRDLQLIELEENIRRKDLSPLDQARAIAGLHQVKLHENPTQTVKQTAIDLAELRGKKVEPGIVLTEEREVAHSILLAPFSEDEDVKKAKSRAEAVRIVRKKLENSLLSTLGALEGSATAFRRDQEVLCGDATSLLLTLAPRSYDVLLFDPPYGIGADTFGEQTSAEGHTYDDSEEAAIHLIDRIIQTADGVLKETASCFIFCDIRRWPTIEALLREANWYVWSTPLIWDKGGMGHCPRPGYGPKRSYEAIVFATRGDFRTLKTGSDLLRFAAVAEKLHAAEKPQALIEELLSWVVMPGASVLDPTCGSGATLLACRTAGLNATGIELSEKFANICQARLAHQEVKDAVALPEIPL